MKTILVLTDFSIRADNAAQYALKLAQVTHANLLLCNVFSIPSSVGMASQVAWPLEDYDLFEEESQNDLSEFVGRLRKSLEENVTNDEAFRPMIDYCSKTGLIADAIDTIAAENHIVMVVIGTHCKMGLTSWLAGDHAKDIIGKSDYPVLLIPDNARFKNYKRIAFASDLSIKDIDVLHSLSSLAKFFDAEILLTHVADEKPATQEMEPIVSIFLTMVSSKINYPKIFYRAVKGKNIINSLDWVAEHIDVDLLVMVHRKAGFFERLFNASLTKKMAGHISKPMLVFASSTRSEPMPVF